MTFDALLSQAAQRLTQAGSPTPRLDAEVLMGCAAQCSRTWLYTLGDRECPTWERARFEALVAARARGSRWRTSLVSGNSGGCGWRRRPIR